MDFNTDQDKSNVRKVLSLGKNIPLGRNQLTKAEI